MPIVKLDWGTEGIEYAVKNKDIIVIVDTLRFSSTVITAIANGFVLYPISDMEKGRKLALSISTEMSGRTGKSKFSLSPFSFLEAKDEKIKKVVLYSPNGAACSKLGSKAEYAFIGALLNAKTVGEKITELAIKTSSNVSIIAAGEQRSIESGELIEYIKEKAHFVFAVEDYLGCGAIISYTNLPKSPESLVCQAAFKSCRKNLKELLHGSFSGKYRTQTNTSRDVDYCAQLNYYKILPIIKKDRIEPFV